MRGQEAVSMKWPADSCMCSCCCQVQATAVPGFGSTIGSDGQTAAPCTALHSRALLASHQETSFNIPC